MDERKMVRYFLQLLWTASRCIFIKIKTKTTAQERVKYKEKKKSEAI